MHLNFQYRELALALSGQSPSVHLLPVLHTIALRGGDTGKDEICIYGHLNVHIFLSLVYKHVDKKNLQKRSTEPF